MFTPLAGKYGRITFGGVTALGFAEWTLSAQADDIDTTHFESEGDAEGRIYGQGICGIVDAEVSARAAYNFAQNPPRTLAVWPDTTGAVFLGLTKTFGFAASIRVLRTPYSTTVRGRAGLEVSAKTNGAIIRPGAATP